MGRKLELLDEAVAKVREAVENECSRDRAYLLEQAVELHLRALDEPDDDLGTVKDH